MNELKLTLVQTILHWENADENINHLKKLLNNVKDTDVIILPEMFTTAFSMNTGAHATVSYERGLGFMRELASAKNAAICGSMMCIENGKSYNRLVWMHPEGTYETYDKRHLFTMAGETAQYKAGDKIVIVEYKGWKIRPLICYDLRFPVWSRNNKANAYDLLIYVANWPVKRNVQWGKLLQARAIENSCYVAGVNRVGEDGNGFAYNGHSMCVTYMGEADMLEENAEAVKTFTLTKSDLYDFRKSFPVLDDADNFVIQ